MIDWLDFTVSLLHDPIPAGRVISVLPDGTTEYDVPKRMQVTGSYESKIFIRSQGGNGNHQATELFISGNPSKFLQGHNVFGCEDINALASGVIKKVAKAIGLDASLASMRAAKGDFSVKRLDVTRSFAFANRKEVQAVLATLALVSRSRMGRPQTRGGTVYHGKNSRRYSVKMYCKAEELEAGKKHRLPAELEKSPIKQFAENLLRVELTLRSMELKELEVSTGADLTPGVLDKLFRVYFGRIEMASQTDIPSEEIQAMPRAIRSTYLLWKEGIDVKPMMSESTFYRHRHELLTYGVDILTRPLGEESRVIPLFRTVTGEPVEIPDWAYEQGLVFDPNKVGG